MTILSERTFDGHEAMLAGSAGTSDFMDVFWAARRQALDVDNALARTNTMEAAYDARIEAIYKATGQRLTNPYRGGITPEDVRAAQDNPVPWQSTMSKGAWLAQAEKRFERDLLTMSEQFPDHRDVIRADATPATEAREKARASEAAFGDALNRYQGTPGGGVAAAFAGGMAGMLQDPVNATAMMLGPWGGAGPGIKGLLWMAVRQGVWNATTEAAVQPMVATWRKEAGLGYGASDFAWNVGMAAALGAGVDLSVRGLARTYHAFRGHVPKIGPDATVTGYWSADEALEAAALKTKSEALRAARDGDEAALRQLAKETGVDRNPEVRDLIDAMDNRSVSDPSTPGTDVHERDAALSQIERHLKDRNEPLPVPPEPLREARGASLADGASPDVAYGSAIEVDERPVWREPGEGREAGHSVVFERGDGVRERLGDEYRADAWILREADGWTREAAETVAARKRLAEGSVEPVEAALLMREYPDALDRSVSMSGGHLRQARALARLDDAAFDMVVHGDADPRLAALVGDLVADPAEHAGILRKLEGYSPRSEAEARQAIGVLVRPGRREAAFERGIDDPAGPEVDVQIAQLERGLADEIAAAEGRSVTPDDGGGKPPGDVLADKVSRAAADDVPEASFRVALDEAAKLDLMAQLMGGCKL